MYAFPLSSTDSRYCKAGYLGVGLKFSIGVSAESKSKCDVLEEKFLSRFKQLLCKG